MATPTNLPASFSTSQILTAGQMNDMRGAFRILQVVQATYSAVIVSNSTTTMADTNLTATITPQSNTSKILVVVHQTFSKTSGNLLNAVQARIMRDATAVHTFAVATGYTGTTVDNIFVISAMYLDSPATTSATTYKTQFFSNSGVSGCSLQIGGDLSTMILMEVSA